MVDRDRPRGADLVLATVASADRAALVVLRLEAPAQAPVDLARELGLAVLANEREYGDLDRREQRVQPQYGALSPSISSSS